MAKLFVIMAMIMLMASTVFAQDAVLGEPQIEPGLTPDNPLWGLELALERLQVVLAGNAHARAIQEVRFAEERTKELEAVEAKDDKLTEIIIDKVEAERDKNLGNAERLGSGISELAKQKNVTELVKVATSHHFEVLTRVRMKLAEKCQRQQSQDIKCGLQERLTVESLDEEAKLKKVEEKLITIRDVQIDNSIIEDVPMEQRQKIKGRIYG